MIGRTYRTIFGAVFGLGLWLSMGAAYAQHGDGRTIEVVATTGATTSAAQKSWAEGNRQSADIGNPQSKGPEQRVALVIGNSAYVNATPLGNPTNDARQVADLLTAAGFEVTAGTDLDHDGMIEIIQTFAGKIAKRGPNTVAFIYYAGHGLQVAGDNFLIPVDARITREADVEPSSIRLVDIMATLEAVPSRMRIVVLDACRNDPFEALKDDGNGLAIVDAPNGSIVAYSTAPGTQAYDGSGRNSPYTAAFLRLARQPNVPIEQFFKRVRLLVNDTTAGRQVPWESSSLTSDFYFFGETASAASKSASAKVAYQPQAVRSRAPREAYDYVIAEDTIAYYEDFIELYPTDPLLFQIKTLLASKILSVAWYNTVLQNSPAAYEAFYSEYGSSQYAQAALKLQQQPKLKPVFQPSTIIVPAQLAPQIKLTSWPQPQLKTLPSLKPSVGQQLDFTTSANATSPSVGNDKDVAQDQRDQQKQRTGLATDQLPLPGKSLLGVRLPARHVDAINPNVRIVALPDAGKVRIGSRMALEERRSPRFVDLPPRPAPRMEQMMPRPGDPSRRFRPGVRVAGEVGGPQQAPRGPGQLQFRGPVSNAVARVGRRCATIDDHPVCR